ncbi:MAG TPA: ABC transporter ATP-binding protein [Kiritimatiellae bacterium]|nr:ABC transporter ATP-binding protein [Kiritimatiellia bacterium]
MKALEIKGLEVIFRAWRRRAVHAVRGVDLSVEENEVVGFLGPNGAGKTTVIHVLLGFIEPTRGEARVFDRDVRQSIARQRIGYLPEHPQLYRFLTGRELLTYSGRLFGLKGSSLRDAVERMLEFTGLGEAADRKIASYSRGMLQRIGIGQALINDPDLVILDEPTSGLDPLGRLEIRRMIGDLRTRGKTVFFSSHELSEVELVSDRVVILTAGRVVAEGRIEELMPAGKRLEQYFVEVVGASWAREAAGS